MLVVLGIAAPAAADPPQEVAIPAGSDVAIRGRGPELVLRLRTDAFLISRETAEGLAVDRRLARDLAEQVKACEAQRARDLAAAVKPDPGWSGWRWGLVGAAVAAAFAGGAWAGSR